MPSYVIPVFPAASRVPPRDALAARLAELTGRFAGLSSELAAVAAAVDSVSGKADKVPPSAAGNLASLDASGNLADSGATPASIKAAAVAEVVANAPGTMDTLKEIADILGSAQQAGTVLKRISDLESGKADGNALDGKRGLADLAVYEPAWDGTDGAQTHRFTLKSESPEAVLWATGDDPSAAARLTWWADDGGYWTLDVPGAGTGYLQQPADARELAFEVSGAMWVLARGAEKTADSLAKTSQMPAEVTVDATLAVPGAAADAAAVGDAMDGKRDATDLGVRGAPEGDGDWFTFDGSRLEWSDGTWSGGGGAQIVDGGDGSYILSADGLSQTDVLFGMGADFTALVEGHRIVGYVGTLAKESQLPDVAGKADRVPGATAGNLAALDAQGNLADSGAKASDFAAKADLPYRLVEPGKWEFSGSDVQSGHTYTVDTVKQGLDYQYILKDNGTVISEVTGSENFETEVDFGANGDPSVDIVATVVGDSLPGHLLDRAVNAVSVTGATTLTLPALVNAGKSRDLLVRLTVSADAAVTFSAPTGETVTWDDAGSPTATYEAGTHLLRFTEVAQGVFHAEDMLALVGLEAALATINGGVAS